MVGTGAIGQSLPRFLGRPFGDATPRHGRGAATTPVWRGVGLHTQKRGVDPAGRPSWSATGAGGSPRKVPRSPVAPDGRAAIIGGSTRQLRMSARLVFTHRKGCGPSRATRWWAATAVGNAKQGMSVAISATATPRSSAVPDDRPSAQRGLQATQRGMDPVGQKLTGTSGRRRRKGQSVALSGDVRYAIIAGMKATRFFRCGMGFLRANWPRALTIGQQTRRKGRWEKLHKVILSRLPQTATRPSLAGLKTNGGCDAEGVSFGPPPNP